MATREIVALNESVPQLQVPQAGDTYLLPRDMDAGGNDITNVNELTTTTVNGQIIEHKLTSLYDSDPNLPIIVLAIGDSIMGGYNTPDATVQTANTNVYFYASDAAGAEQNPATDLSWRNVDPDGTLAADYDAAGPLPYWGLIRNSRGSTAFAVGDRIQKRMNRDVYVVTLFLDGQVMDFWTPSGSSNGGFDSLTSYLRTALDAVPGYTAGQAYAHIVIMHVGTNDATFGVTATDYVTQFLEIYDHYSDPAQNWTQDGITQWFLCQPSTIHSSSLDWRGSYWLDNSTNEYVRTISSQQRPLEADNYHFTPVGCNGFGVTAADSALAGVSAKNTTTTEAYVDYFQPVLGGDIDFNNKIANDVNRIDIAYSGATVTLGDGVAIPSFIGATDSHTWDTSPLGPTFPGSQIPLVVEFSGTHTMASDCNPFGMGTLFGATATITNAAGCDTFTSFNFLLNSLDFVAAGANITQGSMTSMSDSLTVQANAGKTYSLTTLTHFTAILTLGGGGGGTSTVTNRIGYNVASNSLGTGGVLTSEAAFVCVPLLGTNSTNFLGGATSSAIPTGKFNMYQADANLNHWNGGQRWKNTVSASTSLTATAAANHCYALSSTSTVTLTLPTAVGNSGLEFVVKKTGASGTINITSVSSQTFDGAASPLAISTQWHIARIMSDGSNWLIYHNGAP